MKISALITAAVASSLLLVALPTAAFAGTISAVPEPSGILIWAGIAGAGGVAYWWRNRRQG